MSNEDRFAELTEIDLLVETVLGATVRSSLWNSSKNEGAVSWVRQTPYGKEYGAHSVLRDGFAPMRLMWGTYSAFVEEAEAAYKAKTARL